MLSPQSYQMKAATCFKVAENAGGGLLVCCARQIVRLLREEIFGDSSKIERQSFNFLLSFLYCTRHVVHHHPASSPPAMDANSRLFQMENWNQPNVDVDADMAFALALEQEERRVFEARRSAAAATMAAEGGSFGPKVRVALHAASDGVSASSSTAVEKSERWGLAEADAFVGGDGVEMSPGGGSGEWKTGEEEEDGGGGGELRVIPGGGRRKGKMPLFKNAAGEVVSKHDAVICGR